MTKLAYFLLSTAPYLMDYYHLDYYKENNDTKLILFIKQGLRQNLSQKTLQIFDEIHEICPADPLSYNTALDFPTIKNIMSKEFLNNDRNTARIFTYNEFNLPVAAKLRDFFNIEGQRISDLTRFKDKLTVKTKLHNRNINVPKFIRFDLTRFLNDPVSYYEVLTKKLSAPFILKPIDTSGSYGVARITSLQQFLSIKNDLPISQYIYEAEEYIDGDLYHCDAYFIKGESVLFNCSQYNYPLLKFSEGKSIGSIPLLQDNHISQQLLKFHTEIYKALPPPDGIVHTEVFIPRNGRCIFLENSLRAGGAHIIPMYERSFGINLLSFDFSRQMGFETYDDYSCKTFCFWMSFPKLFGRVSALLNPPINSKYDITWHVNVGEQLQLAKSMRDKAAGFISWNNCYDTLFNDFKYISQNSIMKIL